MLTVGLVVSTSRSVRRQLRSTAVGREILVLPDGTGRRVRVEHVSELIRG